MTYLDTVVQHKRLRAALVDAIKGNEPPDVVSGILAALWDAEAAMTAAFFAAMD